MDIVLSQDSSKPIYTQIYEQISSQILCGKIKSGTKLPPIRTVAVNLRVSVIPVKQAWEQLDREGFITTAAGRGTYVRTLQTHEIDSKRTSAAREMLIKDIQACKQIGLTLPQIKQIIEENY